MNSLDIKDLARNGMFFLYLFTNVLAGSIL